MDKQGTLLVKSKECFMVTEEGNYAINSMVDAPKVAKLSDGTAIYGTIREYHPAQLIKLGWSDRIGTMEPGHVFVGKMKCIS